MYLCLGWGETEWAPGEYCSRGGGASPAGPTDRGAYPNQGECCEGGPPGEGEGVEGEGEEQG